MTRKRDPAGDLLAIALLTPAVMTARMRLLGEHSRRSGRAAREAARMVAEKPPAFAEGTLAAQKSLVESSLRFWSAMALSAHAFALTAPALVAAAATHPVRRRVAANARRLRRS